MRNLYIIQADIVDARMFWQTDHRMKLCLFETYATNKDDNMVIFY